MQVISSKDNEIVKNVRKLKEKKYRDLENAYIIEGIKLVKEAIAENAHIKQVVICEDFADNAELDKDTLFEIAKHNLAVVTKNVFNAITDVKTPQGIIAVIEKNVNREINNISDKNLNTKKEGTQNIAPQDSDIHSLDLGQSQIEKSTIDYTQDIIIALDDIQDPGNLGTILRTVDSANLKQIILSKNSADPYNPKVVRSTMGAIFRVNIIETENLKQELQKLQENGFKVMVTSLDTQNSVYDVNYNKKVIVIGNEANGVSKEIQDIADEKVKIPMLGKTESLNASVAAGIMIYEYVRRKVTEES